MKTTDSFDYEKKIWGHCQVDLSPRYLGATRLKYLFNTLNQELKEKAKLLDIGCGGGAFCRAVKRYFPQFSVTGVDINPQALKIAESMGGGINYIQADVYKLPFKSRSFDAVVSFDVWEHLSDPLKAFAQVYRVLKGGGIFHFFVPVEGNRYTLYQFLPKQIYQYKQKYTGHIQCYSNENLIKLLEKSGFQVKKSYNSSYYLYQLTDLMYFSYLNLRSRNATVSVEGYLESSSGKLGDRLLRAFKNCFGWITFIEDICFKNIPGGGLHISAQKS